MGELHRARIDDMGCTTGSGSYCPSIAQTVFLTVVFVIVGKGYYNPNF